MEQKYRKEYLQLIKRITEYSNTADKELIWQAFEFSHDAHKERLYISGLPYFEHCINIAKILIDLKMDYKTVIGGLLLDITIDTNVFKQEIQQKFGTDIANLVNGLCQLSDLQFKSKDIRQEANLRKLILFIAKDIRVIIIKLADRLDNMRVFDTYFEQRNRKLVPQVAYETIALYVPLAHRLGISKIKQALEDLSFKFLNREVYENIKKSIAESHDEQEKYINKIISILRKGLDEVGVEAEVTGRPKSIYSIHKKMINRGYSFDKINDILAIRIIVKEGSIPKERYKDCYAALGVIQNLFKPIQSLYSDYIQNPKENGYQSIHSKVIYEYELNGQTIEKIIEIQIRTDKMHDKAETGIAAHWLYKEGKGKKDEVDEKLISLRQKILDEAKDPEKFIKGLKIDDLFQDEIFVFSPDHDLWEMPNDSTPVDFAFHVHTDVGLHCIGAKVNGKIVPLNYKLKSGDIVEIITSNNQRPNPDWLKFVKTSRARSKIKRWLKDAQFEQSLKLGEELLQNSFKHFSLKVTSENLNKIVKMFNFSDVKKFYAAIGRGDITPNNIIKKIAPEKLKSDKDVSLFKKFIRRAKSTDKGVKVQGLNNLLINFAKCCQPLPGDRIVGFVTKGRGVVIHRTDCKNITKLLEDVERNIDVQWAVDKEKRFVAKLDMIAENNRVFLRDVTESLASMNTNIISVDLKTKDSLVRNVMALEVLNVNHLNRIINRVRKIKGVISVERIDGNGNFMN